MVATVDGETEQSEKYGVQISSSLGGINVKSFGIYIIFNFIKKSSIFFLNSY